MAKVTFDLLQGKLMLHSHVSEDITDLGGTASPKSYNKDMTETTNEVTVPLATMTCSDDTIVFLNGAILNPSNYSRVGNVYTFTFDLNDADFVIFKN